MAGAAAGLKQECGWFMPDYEKHLPEWMKKVGKYRGKRLLYQAHKYDAVKPFLRHNKLAVDVGAHIGLWSYMMALDFEKVIAFEPVEIHQRCFERNLAAFSNVTLFKMALGAHDGRVSLETRTADSSGDTGIDGDGDIPMRRLDDIRFTDVSLIKIDCEGFEASVVIGALATIERCRPVVIVEQKGKMSERYGYEPLTAVKMLEEIGMVQKACISGDYIMGW